MKEAGTLEQWIEVAKLVLAGKFNNADESTIKSIEIGLRGWDEPTCKWAIEKIKELK
jgi:hypothetical protein